MLKGWQDSETYEQNLLRVYMYLFLTATIMLHAKNRCTMTACDGAPSWSVPSTGTHTQHTYTHHTRFSSACFILVNNLVNDSFLLCVALQRDPGCTRGPCNALILTHTYTYLYLRPTYRCCGCHPWNWEKMISQRLICGPLVGVCSHVTGVVWAVVVCFIFPCLYKAVVGSTFQWVHWYKYAVKSWLFQSGKLYI